jgi:hypothetical protein
MNPLSDLLRQPGATLLDVRTMSEFQDGHAPGAMHIPIGPMSCGHAVPLLLYTAKVVGVAVWRSIFWNRMVFLRCTMVVAWVMCSLHWTNQNPAIFSVLSSPFFH